MSVVYWFDLISNPLAFDLNEVVLLVYDLNVLVHLFITKTQKLVFHGKVILRLE